MPDSVLTSARNPRIQAAARLRDRAARDEAGLTLVDGIRELDRAITGGASVVEVFAAVDDLGPAAAAVVERAVRAGAALVRVNGPVLDRLAFGDRNEGVVATVRIPDLALERLVLPPNPLLVVVEGVEKPGNLGAVLRSADAAGADAVIAADPRTDLFNPNVVRASLGTLFTVPVATAGSARVREWLGGRGIAIVAARVNGAALYAETDLSGPVAIVLGSEADGLTEAWTGPRIVPVRLPMLGIADSLNVSVTAAVLLYEARRQRAVRP